MAAAFIGGINPKLLFVVSVTVQMSCQFLWCILSKIIISVFSKKTKNHSLIHSKKKAQN